MALGASAADAHRMREPGRNKVVDLAISDGGVAGWVAASREAVARALASLRRRGLITTGRREITIVDLEGLRRATQS